MIIPTRKNIDKMLIVLMECDFWVISSQMLYNEFGEESNMSLHKRDYFSQRLKDAHEAYEEVKNEFQGMVKQRYGVDDMKSLKRDGEWQLDGNYNEKSLSKEEIIAELNALEINLNDESPEKLLYDGKISSLDYVARYFEDKRIEFEEYCKAKGLPQNDSSAWQFMDYLLKEEESAHTEGLD